jgi:hypothetical protein
MAKLTTDRSIGRSASASLKRLTVLEGMLDARYAAMTKSAATGSDWAGRVAEKFFDGALARSSDAPTGLSRLPVVDGYSPIADLAKRWRGQKAQEPLARIAAVAAEWKRIQELEDSLFRRNPTLQRMFKQASITPGKFGTTDSHDDAVRRAEIMSFVAENGPKVANASVLSRLFGSDVTTLRKALSDHRPEGDGAQSGKTGDLLADLNVILTERQRMPFDARNSDIPEIKKSMLSAIRSEYARRASTLEGARDLMNEMGDSYPIEALFALTRNRSIQNALTSTEVVTLRSDIKKLKGRLTEIAEGKSEAGKKSAASILIGFSTSSLSSDVDSIAGRVMAQLRQNMNIEFHDRIAIFSQDHIKTKIAELRAGLSEVGSDMRALSNILDAYIAYIITRDVLELSGTAIHGLASLVSTASTATVVSDGADAALNVVSAAGSASDVIGGVAAAADMASAASGTADVVSAVSSASDVGDAAGALGDIFSSW